MSYHLNGYGVLHNEAFSSFLGESAERFTFASLYKLIQPYIITFSYREMVEKYGVDNVCSLKLLNGYHTPNQKEYFLDETNNIQWVEMNSLIYPGEKTYIPLQCVVSNDGLICKDEVQFMPPAVSTGTACHESFIKSLENAVIEYLQIDSFNLWWYGGMKGKEKKIDLTKLLKTCFEKNNINDFISNFDIKLTDISFDKDIYVYVCEIFSKNPNLPKYTVGVQGGTDEIKTIYRSIMEGLAVLEYNMHLPWIDNNKYNRIKKNHKPIYNLDDNVILCSKYGKEKNVKHTNEFFLKTSHSKSLKPISSLKKISKYACYLNVTLPDFYGLNFYVSRICIPELLPMCLPSLPPKHHLRYINTGGIYNEFPHPLA